MRIHRALLKFIFLSNDTDPIISRVRTRAQAFQLLALCSFHVSAASLLSIEASGPKPEAVTCLTPESPGTFLEVEMSPDLTPSLSFSLPVLSKT